MYDIFDHEGLLQVQNLLHLKKTLVAESITTVTFHHMLTPVTTPYSYSQSILYSHSLMKVDV